MCLLTYYARLGHFIKSEERLTVTATITVFCISTQRLPDLNYGNLKFKDILNIFSKLIFLAVAARGGRVLQKTKSTDLLITKSQEQRNGTYCNESLYAPTS